MDDFQQNEPQDVIEDDVESASAPDTESEPNETEDTPEQEEAHSEEKVTFDERQQAKIQSIINEQTAKRHEAIREAEKLREQLRELEAKTPQPKEPEIPELPDPYDVSDEEYRRAIVERDKAIAERAEFKAAQKARDEREQFEARKRLEEKQKKDSEAARGYVERAKAFQIKDYQRDAQTVASYLSEDLQGYIVRQEHGPLISNYLAKNIDILDKVRSMNPIDAADFIASEVRPKVSGTRKTTSAPKPAEIVDGGGAPKKEHPVVQRAVFK